MAAWCVIRDFATTEMSLPEAEERVKEILGNHYIDTDWRPTFKAVMNAEGDSNKAASEVEELAQAACRRTGLKIKIPARRPPLTQLTTLEDEVTTSLQDLKTRNRIFGELPSLDEFLEPVEEQEIGDSLTFEGGDSAIVAAVKREMAEKVGEVIEVESDEDEDTQAEPELSRTETLGLCQRLEGACLQFGNADPTLPLELLKQICLFRAHLQRDKLLHGTQTTIDSYFISPLDST